MAAQKPSFLDKVLGRIGRLDTEGLQTVVQRLARERSFLETLFNTIEDGVLVVDETGKVIYFNQAVTQLIGLQPSDEELIQMLGLAQIFEAMFTQIAQAHTLGQFALDQIMGSL